jgi:hypothetical protein
MTAMRGSGSAGTRDNRVDRPDEGLPGVASVENPTANPPTRATLERQLSHGFRQPKPRAVIDTSGTSGILPSDDLKRGEPNAW